MNHPPLASELPLREVLRRRRELPLEEVARLVEILPELAGADLADSWINALHVQWENDQGAEAGDWAARSVREWPPFSLRWKPKANAQAQDRTDPSATLAAVLPLAPGRISGQLAQLAQLIYELLGGLYRVANDRGLSPLPALGEEGNAVLRRAVRGEFADCASFLRTWERAVAEQLSATGKGMAWKNWQVPRWVHQAAQAGEVLMLETIAGAAMPVHLIARRQFRIGRSREQSDLAVRMWGQDGAEVVEASTQISRMHVVAALGPQGPTLRDGDGARPSANGSAWDGTPLDAFHPLPLRERGELTLGGEARIELLPFARTSLSDLPLSAAAPLDLPPSALAPRSQFGAITAARIAGTRAVFLRDAVWIFSEVGGEIGAGGALRWLPGAVARFAFLRLHDAFWIANLRNPGSEVRVDDAALAPGQIAPLGTGQLLDLGPLRFTVTVA